MRMVAGFQQVAAALAPNPQCSFETKCANEVQKRCAGLR